MENASEYEGKIEYIPLRVLDQEYYYTDVHVTHKGAGLNDEEKDLFTKKNSFLMVLDRSGSMCGGPWKALVEGAKQVATRIYEQNEFASFLTMFFNHNCVTMPTKDLAEFNTKIDQVQAQSTTDFVSTFKKIQAYCEKSQTQDLTVLFLTDGNDTCNKAETVTSEMNNLKTFLQRKEISSRFFTIGLSKDHDALLLSKIAQAGSDLGNFFFVDYAEDNPTRSYKDVIKECLVKTFDMGIPGKSLNVELSYGGTNKRMYLSPVEDGDKSDVKDAHLSEENPDKLYLGNVILDSLPDGQLELKLTSVDHSIFLEPVEMVEVDTAQKLRTEIGIINQVFFEIIQKVINNPILTPDESKKIYEKITILDDRVTEMINEGFKIRNREIRKAVMQACQGFKEKCHAVIQTLREVVVNKKTIDTAKIAKLNDLAYKAIRSKGLKRKLDERALKNEEHYKNLSKQIEEKIKNFDFDKLAEKHQEVIEAVGDCPLTCLTALEAMQEGDCLGLCLDVARSEAAIADPNQLIVKDVVPTFMSCSAYLDSAAYNLERQTDAHGSFDTRVQGSLATGVGRENVTGILPLFLFNEHWEIAKRTLPSIFGFMCTLDIMGYADDQYYTIPFTVMFKCLEKVQENPSDVNKKMLNLVKETCVQIVKRHEIFANRIVEKLKAFEEAPISRTKD